MPRNPEIDRMKTAVNQAFANKQTIYNRMKPLGQRRHDLNDRLKSSWNEVCIARDEMNSAHQRQQSEWEYYKSERDAISVQIDAVAQDAERAHEAMRDAFDKASAPFYSQEDLIDKFRVKSMQTNVHLRHIFPIQKSVH